MGNYLKCKELQCTQVEKLIKATDSLAIISVFIAIFFDLYILIKFRSQFKKFIRKFLILRDLC